MSKEIDVEMTAEVADTIAKTLRDYADEVDRHAKWMRERNDISYASDIIQDVKNCFFNLRIDLLVSRPIRELQKAAFLNKEK